MVNISTGPARSLPTVTVEGGPKGKLIINQSALADWQAQGYQVVVEDTPPVVVEDPKEFEDPRPPLEEDKQCNPATAEKYMETDAPLYHAGMKIKELREVGKSIGLKGYMNRSKAKLIEALNKGTN